MQSVKRTLSSKNLFLLLIYVLYLIPPLAALSYILLFGVNVVFWDQWDIVPLFEKFHEGALRFSDLFAPHNEHRIFFPKLVMLLLGLATRYNTKAEMLLILVCTCGTGIVFYLAFRKCVSKEQALFLPVAFHIFSLKQLESFLMGFQICHSMAQFFSLLALFLLFSFSSSTPKKILFAMAILCAFVASFSALSGLLVWPAGFLLLLMALRNEKFVFACSWAFSAACALTLFFYNLKIPVSPTPVSSQHGILIKFILLLIGTALHVKDALVVPEGVLLVCLAIVALVFVLRERKLREASFWIACMTFSLLSLIAITKGRASDVENAMQTRYTIYSIPFMISVYSLIVMLYFSAIRKNILKICLCILLILMIASLSFDYSRGIELGQENRDFKLLLSLALLRFKSQPDMVLSKLYPNPSVVRQRAPVLKKLGYSVFSEPTSKFLLEYEKSHFLTRKKKL